MKLIERIINFNPLINGVIWVLPSDLEKIRKELQGMKRCGNCHYCIKHYHGGLFCHLNQMDTSHNESPCKDWVLEKGKCES